MYLEGININEIRIHDELLGFDGSQCIEIAGLRVSFSLRRKLVNAFDVAVINRAYLCNAE